MLGGLAISARAKKSPMNPGVAFAGKMSSHHVLAGLLAHLRRFRSQTVRGPDSTAAQLGMMERLLLSFRPAAFPHPVAALWDHVANLPQLGRGALVFADRSDVTAAASPGRAPANVLVLELKHIPVQPGATKRTKRTALRKKVAEQVEASMAAWARNHPRDTVHGIVYTNEPWRQGKQLTIPPPTATPLAVDLPTTAQLEAVHVPQDLDAPGSLAPTLSSALKRGHESDDDEGQPPVLSLPVRPPPKKRTKSAAPAVFREATFSDDEIERRRVLLERSTDLLDGTADAGEQEMQRFLLTNFAPPEFPYAIAAEWDFVCGFSNLGRGDLVFSSQPVDIVRHEAPHQTPVSVLVVEIKFIASGSSPTNRRKRTGARQKVREQIVAAMEAWQALHPRDTVHGLIYTNESTRHGARLTEAHLAATDPVQIVVPSLPPSLGIQTYMPI